MIITHIDIVELYPKAEGIKKRTEKRLIQSQDCHKKIDEARFSRIRSWLRERYNIELYITIEEEKKHEQK